MRYYDIEMKGKFILEKLSSVPVHDSEDEARLFYYNDTLYYSDSTAITAISTTGGGAASGNAAFLEGQPGSYYLCGDNFTGSIPNADCSSDAGNLNGFSGSYYLDLDNVTGVLPVEKGGTGATDSTGMISCFGLDDRYGQLTQDNVWAGNNTLCNSNLLMCGCSIGSFCWKPSLFSPSVNISCGGFIMSITTWNAGECGLYISAAEDSAYGLFSRTARNNAVAVYGCHSSGNPARIGVGVCGFADYGIAVSGNTAYCNTSSKYVKHLDSVCLSNCLRETPLNVYKYYWEDSNHRGFDQTIGPVAEDFNNTFNIDHSGFKDGYDGMWTVDGAALGLGIENLKEIDRLKEVVIKLYSCIQKLEGKE